MKKLTLIIALLLACGAAAQESYVQLPPNSTGVKLRMRCNTISGSVVCSQGFFLDDGTGSGALGLSANPVFVNFVAGATTAITASALPLPTGAATESGNLATIATNTGRIPSSPATDRSTAAAPFAFRASDGAAFYDIRQIRALTSADVVTVNNAGFTVTNSPTVKVSQTGTENGVQVVNTPSIGITSNSTDFATQTTLAAIKAKTDNIPADPAREGGNLATIAAKDFATSAKQDTGNASLSTIATNSAAAATAVRQDTGNASAASIDSKTPLLVNSAQPVIIVQNIVTVAPVLTASQLSNPLLYRAAMAQFCRTNLCAPTPLGK